MAPTLAEPCIRCRAVPDPSIRRVACSLCCSCPLLVCVRRLEDAAPRRRPARATAERLRGTTARRPRSACDAAHHRRGLDRGRRPRSQDGLGADGPVATGGTQSTCTWRGVESTGDAATVTIYSEASAADSVRAGRRPDAAARGRRGRVRRPVRQRLGVRRRAARSPRSGTTSPPPTRRTSRRARRSRLLGACDAPLDGAVGPDGRMASVTHLAPTYRLVRPAATGGGPRARRRSSGGSSSTPAGRCWCSPGPGTGKTTTLVEAIVRRIEDGRAPGLGPRADVLPQGRRAAARPGRRPGRPHHVGQHRLDVPLLRLRADPPLRARRALRRPAAAALGARAGRRAARAAAGPPRVGPLARRAPARRSAPAGFAREVHAVLSRAREKGLDGEALRRLGEDNGLPEFVAAGAFLEQYLTVLDDRGAVDYSDLIRRATIEAHAAPRRAARGVRPRLRRRVPGHRPRPGRAAPGARRRRPRPRGGGRPAPVDLRVPGRRGARHPRLPDRLPAARRHARAEVVALGTTRRFGPRHPGRRAAGRRRGSGCPGSIPRGRTAGVPGADAPTPASTARAGSRSAPSTATAPRPSTSPTCCAAPTSRTASPGTRWPCWCGPGGRRSRRCAGPSAPPASPSRSPATSCRWCATRPRCR